MCPASSIRALHVIAGLNPAHGGPSYSVPRLCEALAASGASTTLFSVADAGERESETSNRSYHDYRFHWDYAQVPFIRGLRWSGRLRKALDAIAQETDVVHNHGIWLMPNVLAGRAAARARKPFIVSIRGMLAPVALNFSTAKKRICWSLLQSNSVRNAACLHATSEQEWREIRDFGLSNPVAIIPNGIDLPELAIPRPSRERVLLALGRIHPKKGLMVLLDAWSEIALAHPDWRLRIVGPAEAEHDRELRAFGHSRGCMNFSIEEPLYGPAKTAALCEADLFVLPSLNENFGLTIAEALAAGTPSIATKGTPWSGLESNGCGWWVDHGPEALTTALGVAMSMPREALKKMGSIGRAWMAKDFSWEHVALDMLMVYRWLASSDQVPSLVRFD